MALPVALSALSAYSQFILYRAVPSTTRPGKTDKFPCSALTGQIIDAHDPANWVASEVAHAIAPLFGPEYGVGFVITAHDPFWCLDIDACLTPTGWSATANELCAAFPGAAVEVSQSGTGLHIWGTGAVPPHGCKNTALGIELYSSKRFMALGMPNAIGDASLDQTAALATVVTRYFPTTRVVSELPEEWTTAPCSEWRGPADDDELLRRMFASKPSMASSFGGKATIADLWDANTEVLAVTYPDSSGTGKAYDASSADIALAMHLAFWTGRDMERMQRLMMRSGLVRDKWERDDYLTKRTIPNAVAATSAVYQERPADLPGGDAPEIDTRNTILTTQTGRLVNGNTFCTAEQQLTLWAGFTYVTDINAILTSTGQQLGPEQFKNRYGGSAFIMDNENGKTTSNAWEAFTHSRAVRMPKVDHSAFRPDLDPNHQWELNGESFVNSYRALKIDRVKGDVTPFMDHLAKVLPNKRDQKILLAYMAAIVQHGGVKFQWAPLIQGMQGNGKSLFSRCVAEAVGMRYSHMPRASELAEKYNDWLVGKIFIGVEDVWYPEGRTEIIETLKPMITNSRQPIRAMRTSERTMDVCANFIVNSNHKDAIRTTSGDRRWCVMYCAQQEMEDMVRDGMVGDYFTKLYGWLAKGGYAAVNEFLHTYVIPEEFGLSCLLSRAPETSSTEEALAVGRGRVEQEVMEAIHACVPGFANGWVSSLALDKLLKEQRMEASMPRSKRRDMMKGLGYDWHPGLRDGRLTSSLPGTVERPVMFIKKDHWAGGLKTGGEIIKAYTAAQMPGIVPMGVVVEERVG